MDQNIFISYRRGDSEGYAVRIYDRLLDHFGINRVFMDITNFGVSDNFIDSINQAIDACSLMILIIGPHWDSITDEMGRNRLDDPHDFVRVEVKAALDHNVFIIPVLVNHGKMPNTAELPYELGPLTQFLPIEIHLRHYDSDIDVLISQIDQYFGDVHQKGRNPKAQNIDRWYLKIGVLLLGFLIVGAIPIIIWLTGNFEAIADLPKNENDATAVEIAVLDLTKTYTPVPKLPDAVFQPNYTAVISSTDTVPTITITPISHVPSTDVFLEPEITDTVGVSMILVPQGLFLMGTNSHEPWDIVSQPAHNIGLDMFYIDKYEISNDQYADCVFDNVCNPPKKSGSKTRQSYFNNPSFNDYPVIYVSWEDAKTYCLWRGGRLPLESEWEKAARGEVAYKYPWGNMLVDCQQANFRPDEVCEGDTVSVRSLPLGASPYGVLNMSGNVAEWVQDWFQAYSGGDPNATREFGITHRVVRGGAYFDGPNYIQSTSRKGMNPETGYSYVGFRCVIDIDALP